jgi:hypothetical protein
VALSEKSRSALYQGLVSAVRDEEAVAEMMAYFPARDVEEPVTKEYLRAEMSELRAELRGEMSELRVDVAAQIHRSTVWTVGAITAWSGVLLTAVALLR